MIKLSNRVKLLPPYPFAALDKKKKALLDAGKDVINLSIGDPDLPTPLPIVKLMQEAVTRKENHQYPPYTGTQTFREAAIRWMQKRFGVTLAVNETLGLIGTKEGIANIHYAFINPGDVVLCPSPGYPVYANGTQFAGGEPYFLPLTKENNFHPDLQSIPTDILRRAKMLHINYPNNPTSAVTTVDFFRDVVSFAKKNDLIVCHDAAYSEIYFDNQKPVSFLKTPGAKEVGIEFHSLSKTFNMTGWRIGFACGNPEIIFGLGKIKENVDSGQFAAVQEAGIFALEHESTLTPSIRAEYQKRRDLFIKTLNQTGLEVIPPKATFYVWMPLPKGETATGFADKLMEQCAIVATPGTAFGRGGEGFIRFTLTAPSERLLEAAERIAKMV